MRRERDVRGVGCQSVDAGPELRETDGRWKQRLADAVCESPIMHPVSRMLVSLVRNLLGEGEVLYEPK
jgi:hypothetical protein